MGEAVRRTYYEAFERVLGVETRKRSGSGNVPITGPGGSLSGGDRRFRGKWRIQFRGHARRVACGRRITGSYSLGKLRGHDHAALNHVAEYLGKRVLDQAAESGLNPITRKIRCDSHQERVVYEPQSCRGTEPDTECPLIQPLRDEGERLRPDQVGVMGLHKQPPVTRPCGEDSIVPCPGIAGRPS
ncbi:MAG: hypothetical protein BWY79_00070 [Actinobacteria bacterium ADurb.Bin444]|nr:MAG: hypothetical protein BWY79_00070 [Actinobacteria bacterium ADurb.Bin444]